LDPYERRHRRKRHHGASPSTWRPPFPRYQLSIGALAAYILYRFANIPLAQRAMTAVLAIYVVLMFVHALTGCVALGLNIQFL
jgi:hypothetical protein